MLTVQLPVVNTDHLYRSGGMLTLQKDLWIRIRRHFPMEL